MSEVPSKIAAAEKLAKESGLTVDELCRRAKVNRATWQRWKAGVVGPTLTNWERVQAVLEDLAA